MDVWCSAGHFVHFNSNKASRSVLESDIDFALKPHLRWKIRWNQDWRVRRRWRVKLEASIAFLQTSLFVLFETWIAIHKFKTDSISVLHGLKNILFGFDFLQFLQECPSSFFSFSSMLFGCNWWNFFWNLSMDFTLSFFCYTLLLHFLYSVSLSSRTSAQLGFSTIYSGLWIGLSWSPPPPSSCPQYKAGSSFVFFVTNNW